MTVTTPSNSKIYHNLQIKMLKDGCYNVNTFYRVDACKEVSNFLWRMTPH